MRRALKSAWLLSNRCPQSPFPSRQAQAMFITSQDIRVRCVEASLWTILPRSARPRGMSYTLQEVRAVQPSCSSGQAAGVRPARPAVGSGQDTPGKGHRKTGREVAAGLGQN